MYFSKNVQIILQMRLFSYECMEYKNCNKLQSWTVNINLLSAVTKIKDGNRCVVFMNDLPKEVGNFAKDLQEGNMNAIEGDSETLTGILYIVYIANDINL